MAADGDKSTFAPELARELSPFHLAMMALGMMISAGLFDLSGRIIGYSGAGGLLIVYAFNGLITLLTAMSYAELSSAMPVAGGAYNFARVAFGQSVGFICGWLQWMAASVAGALYAVCAATYALRFAAWLGLVQAGPWMACAITRCLAALLVLVFTYVNWCGISQLGKVETAITAVQMIALLIYAGVPIAAAIREPARLANFKPFISPEHGGWLSIPVMMGLVFIAFEGYEVVAQAGEEAIEPRRNIPKSMLYAVLITTVIYVLCGFGMVVAVKPGVTAGRDGVPLTPSQWLAGHGGEAFGVAIEQLMPVAGNVLVVVLVLSAATSALNATLYSATRMAFALGRDRMLPPFLAAISPRTKTPHTAVALTCALVLPLAVFLDAVQVAASASICYLLLFALVNASVIRVRYHMGDELHYGFVTPFFPVLPLIAILSQLYMAAMLRDVGRTAWYITLAWLGCGIAVFRFYSMRRAVPAPSAVTVLEEQPAPTGEEYKIVVAVANPDNALALVRSTCALSGAKKAQVKLVHMVSVPFSVALSDMSSYAMPGKEAICEAMLYLAPMFPVSSTVRYCRNVARGIMATAKEEKADMLVLGWGGPPRSRPFALGRILDPVMERAPCDVVVLKDCGCCRFKRLLVPLIAGEGNDEMALETAVTLAGSEGGTVVVLSLPARAGRLAPNTAEFVSRVFSRLGKPAAAIREKQASDYRSVAGILAELEDKEQDYDAVVIGATAHQPLAQFFKESVPEIVLRRARKPGVMVRAAGRVGMLLRRWI